MRCLLCRPYGACSCDESFPRAHALGYRYAAPEGAEFMSPIRSFADPARVGCNGPVLWAGLRESPKLAKLRSDCSKMNKARGEACQDVRFRSLGLSYFAFDSGEELGYVSGCKFRTLCLVGPKTSRWPLAISP